MSRWNRRCWFYTKEGVLVDPSDPCPHVECDYAHPSNPNWNGARDAAPRPRPHHHAPRQHPNQRFTRQNLEQSQGLSIVADADTFTGSGWSAPPGGGWGSDNNEDKVNPCWPTQDVGIDNTKINSWGWGANLGSGPSTDSGGGGWGAGRASIPSSPRGWGPGAFGTCDSSQNNAAGPSSWGNSDVVSSAANANPWSNSNLSADDTTSLPSSAAGGERDQANSHTQDHKSKYHDFETVQSKLLERILAAEETFKRTIASSPMKSLAAIYQERLEQALQEKLDDEVPLSHYLLELEGDTRLLDELLAKQNKISRQNAEIAAHQRDKESMLAEISAISASTTELAREAAALRLEQFRRCAEYPHLGLSYEDLIIRAANLRVKEYVSKELEPRLEAGYKSSISFFHTQQNSTAAIAKKLLQMHRNA